MITNDSVTIAENTVFALGTDNSMYRVDSISVLDSVLLVVVFDNSLYQIVYLETGVSYVLSYSITGSADVKLSNYSHNSAGNEIVTTTFGNTNAEGYYALVFTPTTAQMVTLNYASLRESQAATAENFSIKEFLVGFSDEDAEIFFRADTQTIQIQTSPELYSNPIAIITETERGSQMKAFVSLDDKSFYELEGTVSKGISIVKFNSATSTISDSTSDLKPPLTQTIQISYRDSSKQLCRIVQSALITIPTPIDYVE